MPKQTSNDEPGRQRPSLRRRIPWIPALITLAVVISSAAAVRPVRDAATMQEISEAFLVRPIGYVAIAPFSNVFDLITLLSVRQHIAMFLGLIVLFTAWRITRAIRGASGRSHVKATAIAFVAFVLTYVTAVLLPRPMAYLVSQDANVIRVDFHSHTSGSKDAAGWFSVERNRDWHRNGGYDAAFITDHATVAAAERGLVGNPRAGLDSVVLLQGIEATWAGEHIALLGAERTYKGLLTPNLRDVDPEAVNFASAVATREPVIVWNHAKALNKLPPASGPGTAGIRAMEISNGSPANMDKIRPKRAAIVAFANKYDLALTTGTDSHGWGRTAPNWTLMRPLRWRGLTGDELALRIERVIREGGFQATRVVERVVADPGASTFALALTVLAAPARMLTTLSTDERVMWLVWTWLVTAVVWWRARSR
ncbi:MAG TPA: hypothetical protein VEB19_07980 [Gemmatimonadaceae bacterium]|nr:hypothetical protein [Gemmatimonadaceae bacterium]